MILSDPFAGLFLLETKMKKLADARRLTIVGLAIVVITTVLFYAYPLTAGRAFSTNNDPGGGFNHTRTPTNLNW
jgi:hypothetical protein